MAKINDPFVLIRLSFRILSLVAGKYVCRNIEIIPNYFNYSAHVLAFRRKSIS